MSGHAAEFAPSSDLRRSVEIGIVRKQITEDHDASVFFFCLFFFPTVRLSVGKHGSVFVDVKFAKSAPSVK